VDSSAQEEEDSSKGEKEEKELPSPWLGARYRWAEFEGSPYFNSVDLLYKPFVSDRFFLNYHIGLGKAWGDAFHVSTTAGLATGANLISNFEDDSSSTGKALKVLGILSIFVPEGVGYYTVLDERFSIAPYLNVLSYDYRKNDDRDIESFYLSMEAGIEGHFHISKNWNIGLHIAAKPPYLYARKEEDLSLGWDAGVSLHYRR
jgi:hypothetical protein